MKKKPNSVGRPPKKAESLRSKLYLEDDMKFMNVRLTDDELAKLNALAKQRREKVREVAYPLIFHYLNDCAAPDDKFRVTRPAEITKDRYWGTTQEIENPRVRPQDFFEGTTDRKRFAQQILPEKSLNHVREICRYYRIELNDLVGSAIAHAFKKLSGEGNKNTDC